MQTSDQLLEKFNTAFQEGIPDMMQEILAEAKEAIQKGTTSPEDEAVWLRAELRMLAISAQSDNQKVQISACLEHLQASNALEAADFLLLHANGLLEEAMLAQGLALFPQDAMLICLLGEHRMVQENYREAIWYFTQALYFSTEPSFIEILLQKARIHRWKELEKNETPELLEEKIRLAIAIGQYEAADQILKKSKVDAVLSPDLAEHLTALNFALQQKWKEARSIWDNMYQEGRIDPEGALISAGKYAEAGYPEHALNLLSPLLHMQDLEQSPSFESFNASVRFPTTYCIENQLNIIVWMSDCLRRMRNLPKAKELVEKGLNIKPKHTILLLNKALILAADNQTEEAFYTLLLSKKAGLDPKVWEESRAELYFQIQDWQKVREILELLHRQYPKNARTCFLLGMSYFQLKMDIQAIVCLQESTQKFGNHPDRPQTLYTLHLLYLNKHFIGDAAQMIKALRDYYPKENPNYRQFSILLATLWYDNKSFDEAAELFLELHKQAPLERPYRSYLEVLVNFECVKIDGTDLSFSTENTYIEAPESPRQIIHNANVGVVLKQKDVAAKNFAKGAATGFWPEFYLKKALNQAHEGKHHQLLIEIYEEIMRINPATFDDFYDGGYSFALFELGRNEEVKASYDRLFYTYLKLQSGKSMPPIWAYSLSKSFFKMGKFDQAKKYIQIYGGLVDSISQDFQEMIQEMNLQNPKLDDVNRYLQYESAVICNITLSEEDKAAHERLKQAMQNRLEIEH